MRDNYIGIGDGTCNYKGEFHRFDPWSLPVLARDRKKSRSLRLQSFAGRGDVVELPEGRERVLESSVRGNDVSATIYTLSYGYARGCVANINCWKWKLCLHSKQVLYIVLGGWH